MASGYQNIPNLQSLPNIPYFQALSTSMPGTNASVSYTPPSTSSSAPTYLGSLAANQAQYNKIMAGYTNQANTFMGTTNRVNQGYNQLSGMASSQGVAQQQQINQQFAGQRGQLQNQLASQGLGGGAMLGAASGYIQNQQNQAQVAQNAALRDQLIGIGSARLGYDASAQQGLSSIYGAQNQAMAAAGEQQQSQSGGLGLSFNTQQQPQMVSGINNGGGYSQAAYSPPPQYSDPNSLVNPMSLYGNDATQSGYGWDSADGGYSDEGDVSFGD